MVKKLEPNLNQECKICKHEINKDANKCIKCGSYQNWKRYIFFGDTHVLALILALLSILFILWPRIDRLINDEPEIRFSFLYYEYSPFIIKVACSNSGYRDAFLKKAEINLGKNTTKDLYWGDISPVLQARDSKLFDFTVKFRVGDKRYDYLFNNLVQDIEDGDEFPSLTIKVMHSGEDDPITHELSLPRPE